MGGNGNEQIGEEKKGLSKREYIAVKAMHALLQRDGNIDRVIDNSISVADRLLEKLNKR